MSWPLLGAQYVAEAEEKLHRARLLVESVRKEKVDLSNQLEEERRYALPLPCPGRTCSRSLLKADQEERRLRASRLRSKSCLRHLQTITQTSDMSSAGLSLLSCKTAWGSPSG